MTTTWRPSWGGKPQAHQKCSLGGGLEGDRSVCYKGIHVMPGDPLHRQDAANLPVSVGGVCTALHGQVGTS